MAALPTDQLYVSQGSKPTVSAAEVAALAPGSSPATPSTAGVVKQAAAVAGLTDSTGGTVSTTLAAITAGASYAEADMVAAKNGLASLNAQINNVTAALIAAGIMV